MQYFLWYTILLPFYLPYSSLLSCPRLGLLAGTLWILSQVSPSRPPPPPWPNPGQKKKALWLHQAYQLEYHGRSTFVPGLWGASCVFFAVNVWILGLVVGDVGRIGVGGGRGGERGGSEGALVGKGRERER